MLQTESSSVGTRILNFERVVLPSGNKRDVITFHANVNTILP